MKSLIFLILFLASLFPAFAQQKPELDMGKMQMVFLNRDPNWKGNSSAVGKAQSQAVLDLLQSKKCALTGRVSGDPHVYEIMVFKNENQADAEKLVNELPAVKAGMVKADYIAWFAERNYIKAPEQPVRYQKYFFGLLVRGDKWTPGETEESKKIQEGHLANINRLADLKKLVLAGPYFGNEDRRGVFIFKVGSAKEAQELTDTDPAVKAGRLKIRLFEWEVPAGILP